MGTKSIQVHLSYKKFGAGSKALFTFHGFGQNKDFFKSWEATLGNTYTLYAFDLFYHGESTRPYKKLSKQEWETCIEEVIRKNEITHFSILGYSLGGRFAIATALSFPNQVEELILIAPDAVFLTIWFKLITTPGLRAVFKFLIIKPGRLERLIRLNDRTRLVNPYIVDFVRKEMGSHENRERVYISWNFFKPLGYKRSTLIAKFKEHQFRRTLILGSKDYVITPEEILPIIKKMTKFDVHILEKKHHQLLDQDVAKLISNQTSKNK